MTAVAATRNAIPTDTPQPPPTDTPTPPPTDTPTPTIIPSDTPIPTPTETPTPEWATLYGNLQIAMAPYGEEAEVPDSLGDLTLHFKNVDTEEEYTTIADKNGGFMILMPAGVYSFSQVRIGALDSKAPTSNPKIIVPDKGCLYIGRISFAYILLPPGSPGEQIALIQQLAAQGKDFVFTLATSGGIGMEAYSEVIEIPDESEWPSGASNCTIQLAEKNRP